MPRKKKAINSKAEFLRQARAKSGRNTWAEHRQTPEGYYASLLFLRDAWRESTDNTLREFAALATEAERHMKAGRCLEAGVAMFKAGEKYAEAELQKRAEKELEARAYRKLGGDTQRRSREEMQEQLDEWNRLLKRSGISKITPAMRQLKIPKATYYKYRKILTK